MYVVSLQGLSFNFWSLFRCCLQSLGNATYLVQTGHRAEILPRRQAILDFNEESGFTAKLTWPLMDGRLTNRLLGLGRNIISITVAMLTGHSVTDRHVERMQLPFNDFCSGCRSTEEEETVIYFLCQCPFLARCSYRLLRFYQILKFISHLLISKTKKCRSRSI